MSTTDNTSRSKSTKKPATSHSDYATKPPTATNEAMAKWITEQSGVEVSAKAVQVIMGLSTAYSSSDVGKAHAAAREKAAKAKKDAAIKAKRAALEAQLAALGK